MWSVQTVNSVLSMYLGFLAPRPGLEPGTYGLTVRCSTNWAIEEYIWFFLARNVLEGYQLYVLLPLIFANSHCNKKFKMPWSSFVILKKSNKFISSILLEIKGFDSLARSQKAAPAEKTVRAFLRLSWEWVYSLARMHHLSIETVWTMVANSEKTSGWFCLIYLATELFSSRRTR